ncbi:DUF5602 domain-containing protein [Vogesella indigofera]|uniref:DUF5602 domain-containing protein n=1 Tax=Vogesella indigofera TaxID=45465 RepID=UPI00234EE937|nr:DUF5602 domain-containing protein [Vogesella indigofera]MDC7706909.1 DUF5602 domain-containing protein [Vogesella indigofera]
MKTLQASARPAARAWLAVVVMAASPLLVSAGDLSATYRGKPVPFGQGRAHTEVRTDAAGKAVAVSIVFSEQALAGLPGAAMAPAYVLRMPAKGPRTVVDHVVINWEAAGHPPPKVYDVPHFDFHFYLAKRAETLKINFKNENESADPGQQPPAELLPAGYILPPGTAVPKMGVHAINTQAAEFQQQPFTATLIYGYYNQKQTFIEPMVALSFLQSKPAFSAPLARPARYSKAGSYPGGYRVSYHPDSKSYEVALTEFQ